MPRTDSIGPAKKVFQEGSGVSETRTENFNIPDGPSRLVGILPMKITLRTGSPPIHHHILPSPPPIMAVRSVGPAPRQYDTTFVPSCQGAASAKCNSPAHSPSIHRSPLGPAVFFSLLFLFFPPSPPRPGDPHERIPAHIPWARWRGWSDPPRGPQLLRVPMASRRSTLMAANRPVADFGTSRSSSPSFLRHVVSE